MEASAKKPQRRNNSHNNTAKQSHEKMEDLLGSPKSTDADWRPTRSNRPQRIKLSESHRNKKPMPQVPALEFTDQYQAPEKFPQRRHGKGKKHIPWLSEQDQIAELGHKLQKLDARKGLGDGLDQDWAPRNPLVSQFEYETTAHFTEEWRKIPEVPTVEELLRSDVDVPTNIVDAPFDSVEDYLGTHYELVREDTLSGLRAAISYVRNNPGSDDTREIAIYENVELLGLTFSPSHGVCAKVSFSLNRAGKHVRWEQSKRLIPGTLVCVSHDNFETFKVATVAARPISGLEMNPPEVDLVFDVEEIEIDVTRPLLMVESRQGYFEAYKWVLRAMQRMTEKNMALHQHIVGLNKDVGPPEYLMENPVYNLSSIFPDTPDKESVEEINILKQWPRKVKNTMDRSQMEALRTILTKRVAVVQGPPGTGKTYTSVMALHALLQNMTEDDPPVIVACQTNHALDQLLRHVYKFEHEIIRLGGRTQDRDEIKKRTMFNVRKGSQIKIQGRAHYVILKEMDVVRNNMCQLLAPLAADLISPDALFDLKLINKKQQESFDKGSTDWVQAQVDDKPKSAIATWLHDSVIPVNKVEDIYHEHEDAEIDYEALMDLEAEFLGTNNDDDDFKDDLSGFWYHIKHNYQVYCPEGITESEIRRALRTQNLWELAEHMRAAVYRFWEVEATKKIRERLMQYNKHFQKLVRELKVARMEKDSYLMSQSKLVGMTTTGLSKYRTLVASCKPKVILIEEAAECLEAPVLVGCMPSIQHLILVGDHKQLKGKCNVSELQGEPYNLDVSMFERWVENKMPYVALRTQRRMRPEIREILEPIYPGQLRDHESVLGRDPVQGMGGVNMFWHCHSNFDDTMEDTPSKINHFEAEMIAKFVEYLVLNGIETDKITILTFYTGQRSLLAKTLRRNINFKGTFFKIATVDSYQGEENDIIILSLVRSNPEGKIGFLSNSNRVCVSLSRAQRGFYIFGNAGMVTSADKLWWDIGAVLNKSPAKIGYSLPLTCHKHKERTLIEGLSSWDDITAGCRKLCKEKMDCGHECPLRCHPFAHDQYRCLEPCKNVNPRCGHTCSKPCWEVCWCTRCGIPAVTTPIDAEIDEEKVVESFESAKGNGKEKEDAAQPLGFGGIPRPSEKPQRRKKHADASKA